jgi:hypothetical protein
VRAMLRLQPRLRRPARPYVCPAHSWRAVADDERATRRRTRARWTLFLCRTGRSAHRVPAQSRLTAYKSGMGVVCVCVAWREQGRAYCALQHGRPDTTLQWRQTRSLRRHAPPLCSFLPHVLTHPCPPAQPPRPMPGRRSGPRWRSARQARRPPRS